MRLGVGQISGTSALSTTAATVFHCRSLQQTMATHHNNYSVVRFLLAASVIFFHAFALTSDQSLQNPTNRFLWPVTDMGGLAVQLFFLLSGLFVSQSYFNDPNVVRFALKRFFRIFPGLFICLLTTACLAVIVSDPTHLWAHLWSAVFYQYIVDNARLHLNWFIPGLFAGHRFTAINGSIHTLPLEWRMYMIMAAVALVGLLRSRVSIVLTAGVLLIVVLLPPSVTPRINVIFDADYSRTAGAMFFTGMILFGIARYVYVPWWLAVVLTITTLATSGPIHTVLFYLTAIAWTICFGEAGWLMKLSHPKSDLSYGVYIYGWPMTQMALVVFGQKLGAYPLTPIAFVMACACAYGSWHLIERPAIQFGHRMPILPWRAKGFPQGSGSVLVAAALFLGCLGALYMTSRG